MADHNRHLSYHQLEAVLCGRLNPVDRLELKAHLDNCPECSGYLEKAPNLSAHFHAKFPTFSSLQESRPGRKSFSFVERLQNWMAPFYRPALAMSMVLLVAGAVFFWNQNQPEKITYKAGLPVFSLFINGKTTATGNAAIPCASGDTLLFTLTTDKPVYYYILYRDDHGKLDLYFPLITDAVKPFGTPQGEKLPHSVFLSKGWKSEELFCLSATSPLPGDSVIPIVQAFLESSQVGKRSLGLHARRFLLENKAP
ncbi:MAG: hypothetical protein A2519_17075 [Candidatus Raymondbacteria bacterium RIFOXYD12_FULL_49_13]|uniref:Zinc-finger domain-containing protein n=1 Tax=Candidatus Raymondbacteria bacterium RIFOXYD12_FULL_49_13 TaxID=1817890 RepID=A0A1F7F331_UNCRA|nr:MAG: hypothetical protein A2519_17075 [Candidatus Raymondbacteria bacterium RIFOXYD12_FULL_49_13]